MHQGLRMEKLLPVRQAQEQRGKKMCSAAALLYCLHVLYEKTTITFVITIMGGEKSKLAGWRAGLDGAEGRVKQKQDEMSSVQTAIKNKRPEDEACYHPTKSIGRGRERENREDWGYMVWDSLGLLSQFDERKELGTLMDDDPANAKSSIVFDPSTLGGGIGRSGAFSKKKKPLYPLCINICTNQTQFQGPSNIFIFAATHWPATGPSPPLKLFFCICIKQTLFRKR